MIRYAHRLLPALVPLVCAEEPSPHTIDAMGRPPLFNAALAGDADACRRLIAAGADVNARCSEPQESDMRLMLKGVCDDYKINRRETPLHAAARAGQYELPGTFHTKLSFQEPSFDPKYAEVVRVLLAHGADVTLRDAEGLSPMYVALNKKHDAALHLMMDATGYPPHMPLLHRAAAAGDANLCRALLGALRRDILAPDAQGRRAWEVMKPERAEQLRPLILNGLLFNAVCLNRADAVQELLAAGAEVNSRVVQETTPLHQAVRNNNAELQLILLNAGADANGRDAQGLSPLHWAVYSSPESIRRLISAGADPNARDASCCTPLELALLHSGNAGALEVARALLAAGADVNARDEQGLTPLHTAARYGNPEACAFLLQHGAEVNAASDANWTPLHAAVRNGSVETCRLLLAAGANVHARDAEGRTVLALLTWRGGVPLAQLLMQHGADANANDDVLWTVALNHLPSVYDHLRSAGARLTCGTPLHVAALLNRADECKRLVAEGADVESRVALSGFPRSLQPYQCCTPLHLAALSPDSKTVCAVLLELGADVSARDAWQRTPLHYADTEDIARLLISAGAEVDAVDARGDTPLKLAAAKGNVSLCRALLLAGADPLRPGYAGFSARDIVAMSREVSLQKLFAE